MYFVNIKIEFRTSKIFSMDLFFLPVRPPSTRQTPSVRVGPCPRDFVGGGVPSRDKQYKVGVVLRLPTSTESLTVTIVMSGFES